MAVRLHLRLGLVSEHERVADSPDTILIVEPSVGSVARTKGQLHVLVTSRIAGHRAREATRLVAETIEHEYYYDESRGIRENLARAIDKVNSRLAHQRDRLGLGQGWPDGGPIGLALAVVRGHELYVVTVGPAEAYLIRQARLSTLPDPYRERGLPARDVEPDVWRGELSVGDSLCLVSANLVARVGTDVLKDALVTLHPQSAVEHLHGRFVEAEGRGSDGAIALEATEVPATHKARTLVPVRPAEPLAGAPDRSPIPLADPISDGVAAIGQGASRARDAAGGVVERAVFRLQDLLPRRSPAYRRVTALSDRREAQRRAAVAILAFVIVVAGLGTGIYAFGGSRSPGEAIESVSAGQAALQAARDALDQITGPGIDLIENDPRKALALLTDAYEQLDVAAGAGIPSRVIDPLRAEARAGLDRLYGVVPVASTTLFAFPTDAEVPADLRAIVRGPDDLPYVLDAGTGTVWRIDLAAEKATAVVRAGQQAGSIEVAEPRFLAVGGRDLLVLDANNVLWRWRPSNDEGEGTLRRVPVLDSASWGDDVIAIGTFLRNVDAGLYNLYVVDPSAEQILVYSPASDGSGFPAPATGRLPTARDVSGITDLFIDGDIYLAEGGLPARVIPAEGWEPGELPDTLLRPDADFTRIAGGPERRTGVLYAFDDEQDRIVAFEKDEGDYIAQYRLAGGAGGWADLRAFLVTPGVEETDPATVWWLSRNALHGVSLERVADRPPRATPSPGGSASPATASDAPSATPAP